MKSALTRIQHKIQNFLFLEEITKNMRERDTHTHSNTHSLTQSLSLERKKNNAFCAEHILHYNSTILNLINAFKSDFL